MFSARCCRSIGILKIYRENDPFCMNRCSVLNLKACCRLVRQGRPLDDHYRIVEDFGPREMSPCDDDNRAPDFPDCRKEYARPKELLQHMLSKQLRSYSEAPRRFSTFADLTSLARTL